MIRMGRKNALTKIRMAGFHEDRGMGTRIMIDAHISIGVYQKEFQKGRDMKKAGVRCDCLDCRPAVTQ